MPVPSQEAIATFIVYIFFPPLVPLALLRYSAVLANRTCFGAAITTHSDGNSVKEHPNIGILFLYYFRPQLKVIADLQIFKGGFSNSFLLWFTLAVDQKPSIATLCTQFLCVRPSRGRKIAFQLVLMSFDICRPLTLQFGNTPSDALRDLQCYVVQTTPARRTETRDSRIRHFAAITFRIWVWAAGVCYLSVLLATRARNN